MSKNQENMERLVSVITPAYNSEAYLAQAITSVRSQTYPFWEMIIVDDCSQDETGRIAEQAAREDRRIRLLRQKRNQGAASARNRGLEAASGRFIAYLDADDIWMPRKLERQVAFMVQNGYGFSCVSYEVINEKGKGLKEVYMLPKVDYKGFLTNNLLQTVGIMADTRLVDRQLLHMPDMKRRQDAATWLQVLKTGRCCYGMDEVLAGYRRTANSLSSNKWKAVQGVWYLYRNVERLPAVFCCYCFVRYAALAVWKRIYIGGAECR